MKKYLWLSLWLFASSYAYGAKVYIIKPENNQRFKSSDVEVLFGLEGKGIAPAGVNFPETGHHHLLVDYKGTPDMKKPLPASKNLIHFGGGQTQTKLKGLKKGKHTLKLVLADYLHTPHKPPVESQEIVIYID